MSTAGRRVLVAYDTRFGSTPEVAKVVAGEMEDGGVAADLRHVSEVEAVETYAAAIVGSPLYSRHWLRPARAFVRRNAGALAAMPVWFFAMGIKMPGGPHENPKLIRAVERKLRRLAPAVVPRDVGLFPGKLDPSIVGPWERIQVRLFRPRAGDFRDWERMRGWARSIRAELEPGPGPPP